MALRRHLRRSWLGQGGGSAVPLEEEVLEHCCQQPLVADPHHLGLCRSGGLRIAVASIDERLERDLILGMS